jgi:hypothetical protein
MVEMVVVVIRVMTPPEIILINKAGQIDKVEIITF